MRKITLAATQMSCVWNEEENIKNAEKLIREAAEKGANIILLQELFSNVYFYQEYNYEYFKWAHSVMKNPLLSRMQGLAKELNVVLPISFFERCNEVYYNSVAVIDADGTYLGIYRKSHIPDDPGYSEKFYFTPGDTGFKVWNTKYAKIGIGICWDQWFPEAARCMVLQGAEILLYPTAIGTVAVKKEEDLKNALVTKRRWQCVMTGHAIANMVPVVASNRTGTEHVGDTTIRFYGSSFIADGTGEILIEADQYQEGVFLATVDLDTLNNYRYLRFRDRRVDLYKILMTKDGYTVPLDSI